MRAPVGAGERRAIDLGPEARGKSPRDQLDIASQKIETLQSGRTDVDRIDALMNMVGELAIDRTRIAQISRVLQSQYKEDDQIRALTETSTHIVKLVDGLHESMMQIRMLPVGVLFSKFPRVVRDLARSLGKDVNLVVEGEGTEIDRSVIDKIRDPLVHLMRNAVDHGVETPEGRAAAGKSAQSTLKLTARHEQGQILIALEDDGRGIDPGVVREAAVRKGVATQEVADRLSDREALELIFAPGLSTAPETTEVSGRGVGGDVIRRDIESLNGRVEIESTLGVGTTFTLRLPLTLATFGGLLGLGRAYLRPAAELRARDGAAGAAPAEQRAAAADAEPARRRDAADAAVGGDRGGRGAFGRAHLERAVARRDRTLRDGGGGREPRGGPAGRDRRGPT